MDNNSVEPSTMSKEFYEDQGDYLITIGYVMLFIISCSYLNITRHNSMSLFKNILVIVGFGGFAINHLLTGLDLNHVISIDEVHKKRPYYRLWRIVIHSSFILFALLMHYYNSHYEMTIFRESLYNFIFETRLNYFLLVFSHLFLIYTMTFGGNQNIGFIGLMLLYLLEFIYGKNDNYFTIMVRISALFILAGYFMIVFL